MRFGAGKGSFQRNCGDRCRIARVVSATARVVRGACPHDCPDTCALLVEVDAAGRATGIRGAPEHPVTAGFLCGKVSNYLERVYSDERILRPLLRTGAKGEGRFREATWDEALDAAAQRHPGGDRGARRSVGRALQLPRHAGRHPGRRDGQQALRCARRLHARAHHLRERGRRGHGRHARRVARGRPRGVDPRAHHRRVGVEPALDRPASVALHPRGAPSRRAADRRRSLPQPHGARRRLAPAAAARHRRRARARRDARAARHGPRGRAVVPRARARLRRGRRAPRERDRRAPGLALRRRCGRPARARASAGRGAAVPDPPRRGRAAPCGRSHRVPHDRVHPRARGVVEASRRRALVHPDGDVRRTRGRAARAAPSTTGAGALAQHVAHRRGAHRPRRSTRPSRR